MMSSSMRLKSNLTKQEKLANFTNNLVRSNKNRIGHKGLNFDK